MQSETEVLKYINKLADKVASASNSSNINTSFRVPRYFRRVGIKVLMNKSRPIDLLDTKSCS